jgi:glycosyltransferase involved in cell wall biosynthesis
MAETGDAVSAPAPFLSVIVPAHQGAAFLPQTLGALAASDLPRDRWELIVVDDASTDATGAIAGDWADRVVTLPAPAHGPAFARNRGVEASRGEWVAFIDADVRVHPDTLRKMTEAIAATPGLDAVFGAYDEAPPDPGFLSQYRNLLHRYIHLSGAGEVDTFWGGCGAVRASAFSAAGGFDEARYPRPQIEDIELGYRLRDRGFRAFICPEIQGAHLKRWRFWGALRTDLLDRAIPWVLLLLERDRITRPAGLNLRRGEPLKIALVCAALVLLLIALVSPRQDLLLAAGLALFAVVASNLGMYRWFARRRGGRFALAVVPFNLLYYALSGVAVLGGLGLHLLRRRRTPTSVVHHALG